MANQPGALVISLDFELHWGVRDHVARDDALYRRLTDARRAVANCWRCSWRVGSVPPGPPSDSSSPRPVMRSIPTCPPNGRSTHAQSSIPTSRQSGLDEEA